MKIAKYSFILLISLFISNCNTNSSDNDSNLKKDSKIDKNDVHSHAIPAEAFTKHLSLDLKVDFDDRTLTGHAKYQIQNNDANRIIFDVRNLNIEKVTIGQPEVETKFALSATNKNEIMGQALTVDITPNTDLVTIYYATTTEGALAVDWLDPQQTADKKHPFLYTQGQAILTRTWIPCQDSPGIRITYDAKISVPKELMAVMSASNPQQKNNTGVYTFEMKQAIPPYLLALAVGDLEFGSIGARTGVYAEPSMLKASVYEFGDMEKMLISAEELYGKYLWDRYDVIVLPPSFPFGGMENPRLTFATPTILAGDRSLTSLIAHELAHSWSGNLVTNATWNDFWLNEGFTVYFERRIMEALYGADYNNMLTLLGYQDLVSDIADLDNHDTHLKLNLEGRDPDDGMTDIAYEKGCFFLQMLEAEVGRENFDVFVKNYFDKYKFQTLTTEEFVVYLKENLIKKHQVDVNIDEWIYGPGIPANCPKIESNKFTLVDNAINNLTGDRAFPNPKITDAWTTHEWLHFIRHLPTDLNAQTMTNMDKRYTFTKSTNCEIQAAWYELAIKNGYNKTILADIEQFLISVGRRKFLTPLYRAFKENGQLKTGQEIYKKARPYYHSVSRGTMDALLK